MPVKTSAITLLILLIAALCPRQAHAAAQQPDVVWIDGEQWSLMGKPIWHADSLAVGDFEAMMPANRVLTADNYSGFTGHWSIRGRKLYLDSVEVNVSEGGRRDRMVLRASQLRQPFASYCLDGKGICALWYTDTIRAARGETVLEVPQLWQSRLAEEKEMVIRYGSVIAVNHYHNCHIPGINPQTLARRIDDDFPWSRFPGLQRMACAVDIGAVTVDGKALDVSLALLSSEVSPDDVEAVEDAIKDVIAASYPLERVCLGGKWLFYPPGTVYLRMRRR